MVRESQGYLFWNGTMVFGTNDGKDCVNRFIEVAITIDDDVIKLMHPFKLLTGSFDTFVQPIRGLGLALF